MPTVYTFLLPHAHGLFLTLEALTGCALALPFPGDDQGLPRATQPAPTLQGPCAAELGVC